MLSLGIDQAGASEAEGGASRRSPRAPSRISSNAARRAGGRDRGVGARKEFVDAHSRYQVGDHAARAVQLLHWFEPVVEEFGGGFADGLAHPPSEA